MTELNAGAQHLTGDIRVDGAVRHPAPRRLAHIVVRQCAIEVAGDHRMGAVRTDDR